MGFRHREIVRDGRPKECFGQDGPWRSKTGARVAASPNKEEQIRVSLRHRYPENPQEAQGRQQDLRVLFHQGRGKSGPGRVFEVTLQPESSSGKPAALGRRPVRRRQGRQSRRQVAEDEKIKHRNRLSPGPRSHAGLHRRSRRRRSGRHARRHERPGRQPEKDQSPGSRRPGHRSFGDDRPLRHQDRPEDEHGPGIPPQPGTLPVSALGSGGLRQFPRRSAGRRNLPSGQSREPGQGRLDPQGRQGHRGLFRHLRRHGQPYHHGQRPGCSRLGRRRVSR